VSGQGNKLGPGNHWITAIPMDECFQTEKMKSPMQMIENIEFLSAK